MIANGNAHSMQTSYSECLYSSMVLLCSIFWYNVVLGAGFFHESAKTYYALHEYVMIYAVAQIWH